jgi:hypothetical protein
MSLLDDAHTVTQEIDLARRTQSTSPKRDLCQVLERGTCAPCFHLRSRSCLCPDCLQTGNHQYDATNHADPGEIAAECVTQTHASASSCVAQPGSPLASGAVHLSDTSDVDGSEGTLGNTYVQLAFR